MKISVVIPAYNAEKHIARATDSDEVIVVDDGSSDATAEVVRSYGDKIMFIQQENAGASVARNAGIEAASGDWIAFLDADDEWLPEKLKLQSKYIQGNPDLKWSFTNLFWNKKERNRFEMAHPVKWLSEVQGSRPLFEDYFYAFVKGFYVSTITVIIHKSVFETVGLFEPGMKRAQDNDLWYRIAYQYPEVGYLPEPLAIYHLDTPGSSTKINDDVDFMTGLIQRHEELSKQFNRYEAFRPCITQMVQIWIRQLEKQGRRQDSVLLLKTFKMYLTRRFCREMRFRFAVPALVECVFWFKKAFKSTGANNRLI
jgi:glycosyltransferase involved in cell wall biosynthesis